MRNPSTRQILDAAHERAVLDNSDWLSANYAKSPLPEAPRGGRWTAEDFRSAREYAAFQADFARDAHNETPDRLGKTGTYEPKSIYSPAPTSRIKREAPRKRRPAERGSGPDCELPDDPRQHRSYTIEDASGRARGVININPFSKRIHVGGFGLSSRAPQPKSK